MAWMVRLVKIGAAGEGPCTDVMEIHRPGDLVDIANLGLTLKQNGCWRVFNGRSWLCRSRSTRFGGLIARAVTALAV